MVNIKFYTFKERKPLHGQDIIYLHKVYSFDMYGFSPIETRVHYNWDIQKFETDEKYPNLFQTWYSTGNSIEYDPNDPNGNNIELDNNERIRLQYIVDCYEILPDSDNLWCSIDEYESYFPECPNE